MKYSAISAPAKLIQSFGSTAMCSTEPAIVSSFYDRPGTGCPSSPGLGVA